jgi:hypothetical protein
MRGVRAFAMYLPSIVLPTVSAYASGDTPAWMNRYFRRLQQFGKRFSARRSQGEMPEPKHEPPVDPRAKSGRQGQVTADKWNQ